MNIPATPPVRNAMRIASRSPASRAAAATRTFPRTASHIPANPVSAENSAPTTKNIDLPTRTPALSAGSSRSSRGMSTTKTPTVRNCRLR